jgi:membrane-bound metal-dependent hydrolase YbcI (DUF457 family)
MDIVTHAMMGWIVATPLLPTHPLVGIGVAVGSVLPDLDVVSRTFGRRAFLTWHQTYTHSLAGIALAGLATWALLGALELPGPIADQIPAAAAALAAGMLMHVGTDLSNTYGVRLLAPFSRRRICREWVFFIDAFVIAVSVASIGLYAWFWTQHRILPWPIAAGYLGALAIYWIARALLRRRAGRLAPEGTLSVMPGALWPHRFLGCAREGDEVSLFELDVRDGSVSDTSRHPILDEPWLDRLEELPEWRTMRGLSPAYHVVEVRRGPHGDTELVCRDLRTRNFGTHFGQLDLRVDDDDTLHIEKFHV